jgi:antitoxin component of MazEF toxin-antitoxin module
VELSVVKSSLIVKPKPAKKPELKKLLARIDESNLHEAIETGASVGKEIQANRF